MKTKIILSLLLLITLSVLGCDKTARNSQSTAGGGESSSGKKAATSPVDKPAPSKDEKKDSDPEKAKDDTEKIKPETKPEDKKGGIETIYTDLAAEKCKTIKSNEQEEWIVQECPGVGGYKVELTEGDLRQSINITAPSGGKHELDFQTNVSSGFSSFGKKAEWRVKKVDGKPKPIGLITRYNVSENPDDSSKLTSYLVVTKFDGEFVCITNIVKPIKDANVKARQLADIAASKPCLKANA